MNIHIINTRLDGFTCLIRVTVSLNETARQLPTSADRFVSNLLCFRVLTCIQYTQIESCCDPQEALTEVFAHLAAQSHY